MDPIDNNPALVQIMAWRRSGDKPLAEPMMISLSTHICVTRPQWVNHRQSSNSNCRLGLCSSLWFWYPGTLHTREWNPGGFSSGFMRSYRQFGKLYWGDEDLKIFCYFLLLRNDFYTESNLLSVLWKRLDDGSLKDVTGYGFLTLFLILIIRLFTYQKNNNVWCIWTLSCDIVTHCHIVPDYDNVGLILGLRPANEIQPCQWDTANVTL